MTIKELQDRLTSILASGVKDDTPVILLQFSENSQGEDIIREKEADTVTYYNSGRCVHILPEY